MTNETLTPLCDQALQLRIEGRYKELIEHCHVLLEKGLKQNDTKAILCAYIHFATAYYSIGAIEEAFGSIDVYLEYCSQHGDEVDQLNGLNILVVLYDYNKEYDKAKQTITYSIELGMRLGHWNMVCNAYSNYSHICAVEGDFREALQAGIQGLEMAERLETRMPILEFRVKLNIANAYVGLRDIVHAGELVNEMLPDSLLQHHKREKAHCYDLYGRFLVVCQEFEAAMNAFDTAKEVARDIQDLLVLKDVLEQQCSLCELIEDRHTGYVVQQEYIEVLKVLQEQELALTALKLEVKHDLSSIKRNAKTNYLTNLFNRRHLE